eukprot:358961-Chlamydomonas_euryale.AAC.7
MNDGPAAQNSVDHCTVECGSTSRLHTLHGTSVGATGGGPGANGALGGGSATTAPGDGATTVPGAAGIGIGGGTKPGSDLDSMLRVAVVQEGSQARRGAVARGMNVGI